MPSSHEELKKVIENGKWENIKNIVSTFLEENPEGAPEHVWRAGKIFPYLESMLSQIDPDFLPKKNYAAFNTHVNQLQQALQSSGASLNIQGNNLTNFNNTLDAMLNLVLPYAIDKGYKEGAQGEVYSETLKRQQNNITSIERASKESKENIDAVLSESRGVLVEIKELEGKIKQFDEEAFGSEDFEGTQSEIQRKLGRVSEVYDKVESLEKDFFEGSEGEISIQQRILSAREEIEGERERIKTLLSDADAKIDKLDSFYTKIFGTDEEGTGSLKREIDERLEHLKSYDRNQKQIFDSLKTKIEELHDGAINAGLATAYHKMKESFRWPIIWSTVAFVASITVIVGLSIYFAKNPNGSQSLTVDYMLTTFITRLPFYLPLIWLAVFTSKRRSEYSRLQQEYAHKEALAISYDSYKKQIEGLEGDKDEIRQLLLASAINAIAYNASETLDKNHGDNHPAQESISIFAKLLNRKQSSE